MEDLGASADANSFLYTLVDNPEGVVAFLKSLVQCATVQQVGVHAKKGRFYMTRNEIESLISMDALDKKVSVLPTDSLDAERQRTIHLLQGGPGATSIRIASFRSVSHRLID
jgi:hypothetical protein